MFFKEIVNGEVKTVEVVFDVLGGQGDELYATFATSKEANQYIADSQKASVEAGFGRGIYNLRRRYPAENPYDEEPVLPCDADEMPPFEFDFWTDGGDEDAIEADSLEEAAEIASKKISKAQWADGAWGIVRNQETGEQIDVPSR